MQGGAASFARKRTFCDAGGKSTRAVLVGPVEFVVSDMGVRNKEALQTAIERPLQALFVRGFFMG